MEAWRGATGWWLRTAGGSSWAPGETMFLRAGAVEGPFPRLPAPRSRRDTGGDEGDARGPVAGERTLWDGGNEVVAMSRRRGGRDLARLPKAAQRAAANAMPATAGHTIEDLKAAVKLHNL